MEDLTENNTRESSAGQEGIVLKDRNGNDVIYYGIETVTFDTTTEGKQQTYTKGVIAEGIEVQLDLSDGDQTIQAPEGYLVKEATIKKPETLLPENIANNIEVAGVVGTYQGNLLENVPIALDFSEGDQTITAPDGYGVKSAVIAKPENLVPENIKEGETIAGIPGSFKGGADFDFSDENNKFFLYQIVQLNGSPVVAIKNVDVNEIKVATGLYDINVPETIMGMESVIG